MPAILGYDVCGEITTCGDDVADLQPGDFVTALTRFGGYAEYAVTKASGAVKIDTNTDVATATALATQYGTAWYAAHEVSSLRPNKKVLVHAAAGGVGTALVQLAKHAGCTVFGTAGSDEKLEYLRSIGVDHPINYRVGSWFELVKKAVGDSGLDVVYDAIGGKNAREGWKAIGHGGTLVLFGLAKMGDAKNIFQKIKIMLDFGIYHPVQMLSNSKTIAGINMLRIADHRPELLQHCLHQAVAGYEEGYLKPTVAKIFPFEEIAEAHAFLESRQSIGKIAVSIVND